jgi:hypothetical protein
MTYISKKLGNKFRIMVLENPKVPDVYLELQSGLSYEEAHEILGFYADQGRSDLQIEEYYPDANRIGRNPELH